MVLDVAALRGIGVIDLVLEGEGIGTVATHRKREDLAPARRAAEHTGRDGDEYLVGLRVEARCRGDGSVHKLEGSGGVSAVEAEIDQGVEGAGIAGSDRSLAVVELASTASVGVRCRELTGQAIKPVFIDLDEGGLARHGAHDRAVVVKADQ